MKKPTIEVLSEIYNRIHDEKDRVRQGLKNNNNSSENRASILACLGTLSWVNEIIAEIVHREAGD